MPTYQKREPRLDETGFERNATDHQDTVEKAWRSRVEDGISPNMLLSTGAVPRRRPKRTGWLCENGAASRLSSLLQKLKSTRKSHLFA